MTSTDRATLEADLAEIESLLENSRIKSQRLRKTLEQLKADTVARLGRIPQTEEPDLIVEEVQAGTRNVKQTSPTSQPNPTPIPKATVPKYSPFTSFSWDQGSGFRSKNVFVYISLKGVGNARDRVSCDFTKDSFDLRVHDLDKKNYRLLKRGLYKEIDPEKSKFKVKADRVVITLRKTEGEFGPEHWTDLVEKNKAIKKVGKNKDDPTAGLMDLMKQMYDDGDDNVKKAIGEAMLKSRRGEQMDADNLDNFRGHD